MHVSFCATLGEFNQIRFVIALIFFLVFIGYGGRRLYVYERWGYKVKSKSLEWGKSTLRLCCYRMYNGCKNETTIRVIRCLHY